MLGGTIGVSALRVTFMAIDDNTFKQLLRINDELLQLCKWLNENATWKLHPALYPSWTTSPTF
jgi:hypothetical protein